MMTSSRVDADYIVSYEEILKARDVIRQNTDKCHKTPLIPWKRRHMLKCLPHESDTDNERSTARGQELCHLYLKLENLQVTGSYKVRGIINQLHTIQKRVDNWRDTKVVTMSAGNYGKAFAFLSDGFARRLVVLPTTAPTNRVAVIQGYGAEVERVESVNLQSRVDSHVRDDDMLFISPLESCSLIAGHASLGLEIVDDLSDIDVLLVPCGGGALLSGIASAVHYTRGPNCRVYGVEPEQACTMYESLRLGCAQTMPAHSIASGLAPPYCSKTSVNHCQQFVEAILLVSDTAIMRAVVDLYNQGLVVEPSGAAAYAALTLNIVPDVVGKKVVVILTGGNVSPQEMIHICSSVKSEEEEEAALH